MKYYPDIFIIRVTYVSGKEETLGYFFDKEEAFDVVSKAQTILEYLQNLKYDYFPLAGTVEVLLPGIMNSSVKRMLGLVCGTVLVKNIKHFGAYQNISLEEEKL